MRRGFQNQFGGNDNQNHDKRVKPNKNTICLLYTSLHLGLGGITARSVDVEGHLPDEHREFRMVPVGHIIPVSYTHLMTAAAVISLRGLPMMAQEELTMFFYIFFATFLFRCV